MTLPLPDLPPLSSVRSRAERYLRDEGGDAMVDPVGMPLPNLLQGLWIVSYVGLDGSILDGGALAVDADRVWTVSSDPGAEEYIGVQFPEEDEDEDEEPIDEIDVVLASIFESFASTLVGQQARVPKGNGDISGRWVDMPGAILERLQDLMPASTTDKVRAATVDLRPATEEDKAAFKVKYGKSIPPQWTDVHVDLSDDTELIARGKDKAGRTQYLYTEAFESRRDAAKFARLGQVFSRVDDLENGLAKINGDPTTAAARLMMTEGIRVGSPDDQKARVKAYGATTLLMEHMSELPNGNVQLSFTAKEGIPVTYEISDPELRKFLKDRIAQSPDPSEKIFDTDDTRTINLIRNVTGLPNMKNHDLRTLLANRLALMEVYNNMPPQPDNPRAVQTIRKRVAEAVSAQLRNKPAQALSSYINPAVFSPLMEAL